MRHVVAVSVLAACGSSGTRPEQADPTSRAKLFFEADGGEALDVEVRGEGKAVVDDPWMLLGDQDGAALGSAVSSTGDVNGDGFDDVAVGAWAYDNPEFSEGIVLVFHGSSDGLSTEPDWMAEGETASAGMGWALAPAGDVNGDGYADLIVGYRLDPVAKLFLGSADGLESQPAWEVSRADEVFGYGWAVSSAADLNGDGYDDVVVADPFFPLDGGALGGEVFVYAGSPSGLGADPVRVLVLTHEIVGGDPVVNFGFSIAQAGDVDGDGYDDLVTGAPNGYVPEDVPKRDTGLAVVWYGSDEGLTDRHTVLVNPGRDGGQSESEFGASVSSAGDVDGDGFDDVLVGAPEFSDRSRDRVPTGAAFLYRGSAAGISAEHDQQLGTREVESKFGTWVASAGDLNRDGFADAAIGIPQHGFDNRGAAVFYLGSEAGLRLAMMWEVKDSADSGHFGTVVAPAGDVNGDSAADVIVGAPFLTPKEADLGNGPGAAFLFHGVCDDLDADDVCDADQID